MDTKDLLSLSKNSFMKAKIVASMHDLLRATSVQKLTVTMVCEHAGISRSSFYHLFTDLSDAMSWEIGHVLSDIAEQYPLRENWREDLIQQLIAFMEYCQRDEAIYKKISVGMDQVDPGATFCRTRIVRKQWFLSIIEDWQGKPADEDTVFQIEFFVCGESTALVNWGKTMKEAPQDVAEKIVACIPEHFRAVMEAAAARYYGHSQDLPLGRRID